MAFTPAGVLILGKLCTKPNELSGKPPVNLSGQWIRTLKDSGWAKKEDLIYFTSLSSLYCDRNYILCHHRLFIPITGDGAQAI